MEPTDLTVRILQEIRDEIRDLRTDQRSLGDRLDTRMEAQAAESRTSFEAIETAIRDMAEQLVMLARGIRTALDARGRNEDRIDDHERRLQALEHPKSA